MALAQQEVCTTLMRGLLLVHQDQASVLRPKYNHMNKLQKYMAQRLLLLSKPEARPRIGRGRRDGRDSPVHDGEPPAVVTAANGKERVR